MRDWVLAWRFLRRDLRAGELRLLLLALLISTASVTAIALMADRLTRTMTAQAADFLAADLVVESQAPLPQEWLEQARRFKLATAQAVEFTSVLVENDQLLLVGIKAVSAGYPLRGYLKTSSADLAVAEEVTRFPPAPGKVWVAPRVLHQLKLKLGDRLEVGKSGLIVERLLTFEPDLRTSFYSLAPRVIMRVEDLPATGILAPGSRASFRQLFAGEEAEVKAFRRFLKAQLKPNQRLLDVHEDRPDVGRALRRAERYLGLASALVVLIAGVAVAMAARRYSERHFDASAVMKALGANSGRILRLYAYQFTLVGLIAGGMGVGCGFGIQEVLVRLLRAMLPEHLLPPAWLALGFGPATAFALLLAFALPPLLRLKQVSPAMALRHELAPPAPSVFLVYGLGALAIFLLVWRFTQDLELSALLFGAGSLLLALLAGVAYALLKLAQSLDFLGPAWRLGLNNLRRYFRLTLGQVLAFSLTLAAMTLSFLVRSDLVETWQAQLPQDAPNYFVINVMPEELADFQKFLTLDLQAKTSRFFPIVRGRLVEVNGKDVHRLARPDSEGEMAINRDLSLTWAKELPPDNCLVAGKWWQAQVSARQVSVEQDLAKSLGIKLQDRLSFVVEDLKIDAKVVNLRAVKWDSMLPNFYMIFSPGDLDGFAATYLASFYLPPERKAELADLIRRFPNVTLVEVDMLLQHLRAILQQVSFAVDYVLGGALLAGFIVLMTAVQSSLDERLQQGALLRALGGSTRLLRLSLWIEFLLLGAMSGMLAVLLSEAIAWILYVQIFNLPFRFHAANLLLLPLLGAGLTGLFGILGTRRVLKQSPLAVLREL
jgi:putative ABC transport system permease protein